VYLNKNGEAIKITINEIDIRLNTLFNLELYKYVEKLIVDTNNSFNLHPTSHPQPSAGHQRHQPRIALKSNS
jgi:hypothetical protein